MKPVLSSEDPLGNNCTRAIAMDYGLRASSPLSVYAGYTLNNRMSLAKERLRDAVANGGSSGEQPVIGSASVTHSPPVRRLCSMRSVCFSPTPATPLPAFVSGKTRCHEWLNTVARHRLGRRHPLRHRRSRASRMRWTPAQAQRWTSPPRPASRIPRTGTVEPNTRRLHRAPAGHYR